MGEKKVVTREPAPRYRKPTKKGKQKTLDELTQTTVYDRKYACHVLSSWGKASYREVDGKLVKFIVGKPRKPKKRPGRRIYGEAVRTALEMISELFDYMCGKRLAVLIRINITLLSYQSELGIDEAVQAALVRISPATID